MELESAEKSGGLEPSGQGAMDQAKQKEEEEEEEEEEEQEEEEGYTTKLIVEWNGHRREKPFVVFLFGGETYYDFQVAVYSLSDVPPDNQKLFSKYLRMNGKPCEPTLELAKLNLPRNVKVKLFGKTEEEMEAMHAAHAAAMAGAKEVVDDFDWDYMPDSHTLWSVKDAERKLQKKIRRTKIELINQPRPGKKLLVLDLDHTLLHFSTRIVNTHRHNEIMRPYMHEFLAQVYPHYDIVIWSQTAWNWVEIKLTELNMLFNPNYSICFALDTSRMFRVVGIVNGKPKKHKVKPLGLIWAKFPQWSVKNTVHIDDLAKNFAMNPQAGLRCKPYKRRDSTNGNDDELQRLAAYLVGIATQVEDFQRLNHNKWEAYMANSSS